MPTLLTDSPYLKTIPAVHATLIKVVTPSTYVSWNAMFNANTSVLDFLLTPGDYTALGLLTMTNRTGGSSSRPRTIRYYHQTDAVLTEQSAYERNGVSEARLGGINVDHTTNPSSHWMFIGLTCRVPDNTWKVSKLVDNITFDRCFVDGFDNGYGMRLWGTNNIAQRCVFQDSQTSSGVGVQFKPLDGNAVSGKVLDCEMINCGDGVIITDDADNPTTVPVHFVIDGCDIWIDDSTYEGIDGVSQTGGFENGIDVKMGDPNNQSIISNTRIWGMRRTTGGDGGAGDAIVLHQHAQNILIEGCIFDDCSSGIREEVWPEAPVRRTRSLVIQNNKFKNILKHHSSDTGACVAFLNDGTCDGNAATGCNGFLASSSSGFLGAGPTFEDNILCDTDVHVPGYNIAHPTSWADADNTFIALLNSFDTYQRKRFTGPETAFDTTPLAVYGTTSHRRSTDTRPASGISTADASHRIANSED